MTLAYFKVLKNTPAYKAQQEFVKLNHQVSLAIAKLVTLLNLPRGTTPYLSSNGVCGFRFPNGVVPEGWRACKQQPGQLCLPVRTTSQGKALWKLIAGAPKPPGSPDVMRLFLGMESRRLIICSEGGRQFIPGVNFCITKGTAYLAAHTATLDHKDCKPLKGLKEITGTEYAKATGDDK